MFRLLLTILLVFLFSSQIFSQFNVLEKVKKKVNKTVEKNIDEAIDKTVDGAEKDIKEGESKGETPEEVRKEEGEQGTSGENSEAPEVEKQELKLWSKYDFVPGDQIILDDDLKIEESGEFPSRWDLISGNAENASLGEDNVINFAQNKTVITPLMETEEYLPEVFTLEFDVYFHDLAVKRTHNYYVQFWTTPQNRPMGKDGKVIQPLLFKWNTASMGNFKGKTDKNNEARKIWKSKWKHIAIAFNKRSLKVYLDEIRVLNIPNLGFKPKLFAIGSGYDDRYIDIAAIKNIRLAEGGKKLYDRIMSDGKFVTRGILFDINQSTIKPESMGVLNEIVEMMKNHVDLKFSIEGHTDSDGDTAINQTLSEKRASAVKSILVELGIDEERFSTKGFGESVPVDTNETPEGKANNRRVEFVVI